MKRLILLFALVALLPNPAQASWAIALVTGGNPIVAGHYGYHVNFNDAPDAIATCNRVSNSTQCKIIAQSPVHSCAALANNGAKGTAIRWTVGQSRRKDLADDMALKSCDAQFPGRCKMVHDFCR
jgi:hypothetical protein